MSVFFICCLLPKLCFILHFFSITVLIWLGIITVLVGSFIFLERCFFLGKYCLQISFEVIKFGVIYRVSGFQIHFFLVNILNHASHISNLIYYRLIFAVRLRHVLLWLRIFIIKVCQKLVELGLHLADFDSV
jgi:hypothetical protein